MVTPQTNTTLAEIAQQLLQYQTFCVCGHVKPDGDCVGSTLGLAWMLRSLGKSVTPLLAEDHVLDPSMGFLPLTDEVMSAVAYSQVLLEGITPTCPAEVEVEGEGGSMAGELDALPTSCDVFVCVDVPNELRLGEAATALKRGAKLSVTVDHHAVPERMSDLSYTDPEAASTTMLVWKLAKHLGATPDMPGVQELATCIYTGLSTDTGSFMHQNTDERAFACARELVACGANPSKIAQNLYQGRTETSVRIDGIIASNMEIEVSTGGKAFAISFISKSDMDSLGASYEDAEHAISLLRSIVGVDVACVLKEQDGMVRGSLRAKDDTDMAAIAREFGGGGHVAAAGFTFEGTLCEALSALRKRLSDIA